MESVLKIHYDDNCVFGVFLTRSCDIFLMLEVICMKNFTPGSHWTRERPFDALVNVWCGSQQGRSAAVLGGRLAPWSGLFC